MKEPITTSMMDYLFNLAFSMYPILHGQVISFSIDLYNFALRESNARKINYNLIKNRVLKEHNINEINTADAFFFRAPYNDKHWVYYEFIKSNNKLRYFDCFGCGRSKPRAINVMLKALGFIDNLSFKPIDIAPPSVKIMDVAGECGSLTFMELILHLRYYQQNQNLQQNENANIFTITSTKDLEKWFKNYYQYHVDIAIYARNVLKLVTYIYD